ncbi:CBO0543 family protein [Virgibacillus kekensis]|uniref:CBO0543 family protein n=1 Tax=Virgibacillus kekensis TaxID=202261 RepID=A0ABV9DNC7_9BACI
MTKIEIYATGLFAFSYGALTDMVLDLHYHLYGYFEKGFQWLGLLGIILYFPSISFLFLNFFPSDKKKSRKILYVLLWSLFAIIFEWFALKAGYFYYNGWKLWYSCALYPFIFLSLILNLRLIQRLNKSS